jgi:hypothetical protein
MTKINPQEIDKKRTEAWDEMYRNHALEIYNWAELASNLDDIIRDILEDLGYQSLE